MKLGGWHWPVGLFAAQCKVPGSVPGGAGTVQGEEVASCARVVIPSHFSPRERDDVGTLIVWFF